MYILMLKNIFYILCFLLLSLTASGQPVCYFEHYGVENGLSQHTVMDILQDKKGFMWFSTWNGFNKFDGYEFTNYITLPGDEYYIKNNRIDKIYEDKYGYIWLYSYDREAHRFDPKTEKYMGLKSLSEFKDFNFSASKIVPTPSGKVWLLSDGMGCVCIMDSTFAVQTYNIDNERLSGKTVYSVWEDSKKNSWILTDNGLALVPANETDTKKFFGEIQKKNKLQVVQPFFSVLELDKEIWFGSDKGRIWKYQKQKGHFDLFEINATSPIIEIKKLSPNQILIVTSQDGFFIFNEQTGKTDAYNANNLPDMKTSQILSSYVDKFQKIWFHLPVKGVAKFDPLTGEMKHFTVKTEDVSNKVFPPNFFIFEDQKKRLWVHPDGGGFSLYDREKDILLPFYDEPGSPGWRFSNMMHAAFSDKQGNLWLCSRSNGLEKIIFENDYFQTMYLNQNTHSTVSNNVRAIFEDADKNMWISSKDGYIRVYDNERKLLGYVCEDGRIGNQTPLKGIAYCITQDKQKNMWIATKGEGIYRAVKNSSGQDLSFQITHYRNDPGDIYSLSNDDVYTIFQDRKGRIWIGTYGGGLNLIENTDKGKIRFINHRNKLKNYPIESGYQVRVVDEDKFGNICVGTTIGLIMFSPDFESAEDIQYKRFSRTSGEKESLSANDIFYVCTTKKGETFLATYGGGINKIEETDENGFPLQFKAYTKANGLPSNVILSMMEDDEGSIWIASENNLSRFNPDKEIFETFGDIKRLMHGQTFSEASICYSHLGKMIFGLSKGIISFDLKQIRHNVSTPPMALVQFRLFNKLVPIGEKSSPLKQHIDYTKSLILTHKQNFFSIEYAALDYTDPEDILYAYKLDGFDEDWVYVQKQRIANYTNLPKGKYTFRVKSTNSDGVWVDNERTLSIEVLPSFWETTWAYFLYLIAFVLLVLVSVRILFVIYRLKDKVELEHEQAEMKLRFFTDISHEIRTPLTMVVSPIEYMLHDQNTPPEIKKQLNLVSQNTNRMLRMVNQILDLRKIQHQQMTIQEIEISPFVKDICGNFEKTARDKNIHFQFIDQAKDEKIWIDKDFVEKIVYNLLSNAFKYTSPGKSIQISVIKDNNSISIQIKDEGVGITREKQKSLFNRFASFNEDKSKPSSGIGLSIVKELAEKLHAKVLVESEPDKGSCFTIVFKTGLSHYDKDTNFLLVQKENSKQETTSQENESYEELEENTMATPSKPIVLIVEDDNDLRNFLKTILAADYKVYTATDGLDGYDKALELVPDFIVSDIMMPRMDGVQLLQQIKTHVNTSHIPFILLTAKSNIESKLEGLSYGADDYITKPFNVPYFRARIENLLQQRRRLQEIYKSELVPGHTESITNIPQITSSDEAFMTKIMHAIEENMNNEDFFVEDLVSVAGMSRTVFFRKIKSMTGLAPVEFIRDIKIKRAAQIISTGQFSIKETSYMVGISDTKYFSKCFKKKYGVTPVEYKNQAKNT